MKMKTDHGYPTCSPTCSNCPPPGNEDFKRDYLRRLEHQVGEARHRVDQCHSEINRHEGDAWIYERRLPYLVGAETVAAQRLADERRRLGG